MSRSAGERRFISSPSLQNLSVGQIHKGLSLFVLIIPWPTLTTFQTLVRAVCVRVRARARVELLPRSLTFPAFGYFLIALPAPVLLSSSFLYLCLCSSFSVPATEKDLHNAYIDLSVCQITLVQWLKKKTFSVCVCFYVGHKRPINKARDRSPTHGHVNLSPDRL